MHDSKIVTLQVHVVLRTYSTRNYRSWYFYMISQEKFRLIFSGHNSTGQRDWFALTRVTASVVVCDVIPYDLLLQSFNVALERCINDVCAAATIGLSTAAAPARHASSASDVTQTQQADVTQSAFGFNDGCVEYLKSRSGVTVTI